MWHVLQLALVAVCGLARLSARRHAPPVPSSRAGSSVPGREPEAASEQRRRTDDEPVRRAVLRSTCMIDQHQSLYLYFPSGHLLLTGYLIGGIKLSYVSNLNVRTDFNQCTGMVNAHRVSLQFQLLGWDLSMYLFSL